MAIKDGKDFLRAGLGCRLEMAQAGTGSTKDRRAPSSSGTLHHGGAHLHSPTSRDSHTLATLHGQLYPLVEVEVIINLKPKLVLILIHTHQFSMTNPAFSKQKGQGLREERSKWKVPGPAGVRVCVSMGRRAEGEGGLEEGVEFQGWEGGAGVQ